MRPSRARPPRSRCPRLSPARPVRGPAPSRHRPTTCGTCGGRGRVRTQNGIFAMERGCPTCQGQGQVISDPCRSCGGAGKVAKDKQLSVNIPAGVEDGTRIRLSGEGELGQRGGPSGDLYIFLNIRDHDLFEREAQHLFISMPISMTTAALGGEIEVPSIDGARVRVKIPARARNRAAAASARQGYVDLPPDRARRSLCPGRGRDPDQPDQAPARAAGRV